MQLEARKKKTWEGGSSQKRGTVHVGYKSLKKKKSRSRKEKRSEVKQERGYGRNKQLLTATTRRRACPAQMSLWSLTRHKKKLQKGTSFIQTQGKIVFEGQTQKTMGPKKNEGKEKRNSNNGEKRKSHREKPENPWPRGPFGDNKWGTSP